MKKLVVYIYIIPLLLISCSNYQKLLKSNDTELKYNAAKNYFQEKKYNRSATLFDNISAQYRGTNRSQEILYLLSESYFGQKDYFSAVEHYKIYIKNYPQGDYIREAMYQKAYCYYLLSPDVRLDQEKTEEGLSAFEEYITIYPNSEKTSQAYSYLNELQNKLAKKAYLNARTYYRLGLYIGNNYRSAIIESENALKDYPESNYREDFYYMILCSKHKEAIHSIAEKKNYRYREVVDEYYNYKNEYAGGKYAKDAEKILKEAKNYLKE